MDEKACELGLIRKDHSVYKTSVYHNLFEIRPQGWLRIPAIDHKLVNVIGDALQCKNGEFKVVAVRDLENVTGLRLESGGKRRTGGGARRKPSLSRLTMPPRLGMQEIDFMRRNTGKDYKGRAVSNNAARSSMNPSDAPVGALIGVLSLVPDLVKEHAKRPDVAFRHKFVLHDRLKRSPRQRKKARGTVCRVKALRPQLVRLV